MDIMELGAIGELVGGVAVIASLIYVGFQVRQSNSVARAAAGASSNISRPRQATSQSEWWRRRPTSLIGK